MAWFWLITVILLIILLYIAIKKEWNGFLLICNLLIFLPSFVFTLVLLLPLLNQKDPHVAAIFTGMTALLSFIGIIKVLFRSRCPQCKKFFSAKKNSDELIQYGNVYYKKDNSNNNVAYQKNVYKRTYICKHCSNEWTRNIQREELA